MRCPESQQEPFWRLVVLLVIQTLVLLFQALSPGLGRPYSLAVEPLYGLIRLGPE